MPLASNFRTRTADTSKMTLYGPDGQIARFPDKDSAGQPLPPEQCRACFIELYSADSRRFQAPLDKFTDSQKPNRKSKSAEARAAYTKALVNCTASWLLPDDEGNELECSADNALEIYSDPGTRYIVEQCDKHMGDRENYLGESFAA